MIRVCVIFGAVIFILALGNALSKHKAVITTFRSRASVKEKEQVSAVMTLFRTVGIRLFYKRERSVLFYSASGFTISVYNLTSWYAITAFSS